MSLLKSSFSNAVKLLVLLRRCVLFRPHLEPWRNYLSWARQLGRGSFSEGPPPSPHNFGERSPPPPSSSLSTQQGVFSVLLSQPFAHNISKRSPPPILEPQPTKPSLFAFLWDAVRRSCKNQTEKKIILNNGRSRPAWSTWSRPICWQQGVSRRENVVTGESVVQH